ncbi:hypothetical protein H3H36_10895 [Duganella sp. FT3S]|uniref:HTH Mu-type domain-containing protein n=1 Tax=Rugamonas fusca TaxID=2758568 RepID=A0A7W2EH57_9BURK|nr:hypothetical protein [Rugamonas fusca]MBA5605866.1 hypothetical protein [Rugamonas fusca]
MEKLLSASEIAALKIPGLPTTRAAVNVMAKRDGWEFELATGIGGTRRLYRLPAKYLPPSTQDSQQRPAAPVVGTIVRGSSQVDMHKLELAIKAVDTWEQTRDAKIDADRRPAVITVLYEFLVKSEGSDDAAIDVVLRALG